VLPEERRLHIVEQVRAKPLVRADELARRFGVSIETVRRDLDALQRDGLVRRVYGGATGIVPRTLEASFDQREALHVDAKRAIARLAASLVKPTDVLVLDVGTTVAELARALPADYHGRVLTNSLLVAAELGRRQGIEVEVAGGRLRGGDLACSGAHAEAFFGGWYADKAFLGSGGVHPDAGLTDYHPDEVSTRQVILAHTAEPYVLADSSKLGQVALRKVCDLDRITAVITDDQARPQVVRQFEALGVRLLVAGAGQPRRQTG
jgi:DeoR family transcriptional regulator, fructose operon transcriptional repressor